MSSGEPAAEPADFLANQAFLRRLALSLVRDPGRAEDLVQDTWAAWSEHGGRTPPAAPRAWLARVLKNRATNERRGRERRAQREAWAARPERVDPEAGVAETLEVQAQVVAALRTLEEPYRTALVERYYHDLSPLEIARRSGVSINTVKARLTRGLERLRAELDRRHGGERTAWSHWLWLAARPPGAGAFPEAGAAAAAGANSWLTLRALLGGALLPWLVGAGVLAGLVAFLLWLPRRTRAPLELLQPVVAQGPESSLELRDPGSRVAAAESAVPVPEVEVPATLPPPAVEAAPPLLFGWPQLFGTTAHDNFELFQGRAEYILRPQVLWHVQGTSGQPTLAEGDLYTGGGSLLRVDLVTGKPSATSAVLKKRLQQARATSVKNGRERSPEEETRAEALRHPWWAVVVAAPAIAGDLVIARFSWDGSVTAFDRSLEHEAWTWEAREPEPNVQPVAVLENLVLVAQGTEVVALRALNGTVEWRFDTGKAGAVRTTPAGLDGLVFFATEGGVVFALDQGNGRERWRRDLGRAFGGTQAVPVALEDRLLLADVGPLPTGEPRPEDLPSRVWALQSFDGRELWSTVVGDDATAAVGMGAGFALVGMPAFGSTASLALDDGDAKALLPIAATAGAPTVVGDELVVAAGNELVVLDAKTLERRWTFRLPAGEGLVTDFVHTGDRVYVATTLGLFALADEPGEVPPDFVLEWDAAEGTARSAAESKARRSKRR